MSEAIKRVEKYLATLKKMRTADQEQIHAFNVGEPSEAYLLVSDLKEIIEQHAALLAALTMGAQLNTPDMMDWVASRLVNVHGENPRVDYVLTLVERAKAGRAAIARARGANPEPTPAVAQPVEKPKDPISQCTGDCTFVNDPQPDNKWQHKCSKCGDTIPF